MIKAFKFIGMILIVLITTTFPLGCSNEYDDSLLTDRVDNLENRVNKLEELCSKMNTNINSLQTIINVLQDRDYITNVTPIAKEDKTIGYTITFAKSNPITIYHGKDGANGSNGTDGENGKDGTNGKDGITPLIGIKQDSDGIFYWTVNNEWLLDKNGTKIKAQGLDGSNGVNGKDGIIPKLKIQDNYWYVSYDNGSTWTELGKATGKDDDNIFSSVSQDEYNVYFNLANGTTITISKNTSNTPKPTDSIRFDDVNVKAVCLIHWDINNDGELSYEEAAAVATLNNAFENNSNIIMFRELRFFTGLTAIKENEFSNCKNLIHIVIPDNVVIIDKWAFSSCYKLANIVIGKSVETIGAYAFYCSFNDSEVTLTIPKSVKYINEAAFKGITMLTTLYLGNGVEEIGKYAFTATGIKEVIFGENLKRIGEGAFENCSLLQKVMIGSKVSHIGEKAFNFCNITELYSKVESLFTIAANTFHNNGRGCTLYVPKGYIELYKNTSGWNNFTKYQEM